MKEQFILWLKKKTSLSESSIGKYARGVTAISNDMLEQEIIYKSLIDCNEFELDLAIDKILKNDFFVAKNKRGNNMYSNSLKQYRYFIKDISENINEDVEIQFEGVTEKLSEVKSRVGQGEYRQKLIEKYDGKCLVTGIDITKLLVASHIKPWAVCDNRERLDGENGLLLSANMDKLFDSGLITFKNSGDMLISGFVGKENEIKLNIKSNIIVDLKTTYEMEVYLEYHRDVLFVK